LDKIYALMTSCGYSFHDLSRVELDNRKPRTPRFNMPFELGLLLGWQKTRRTAHTWFVLESVKYRLHKSLSDLDGTDPLLHNGTPVGILRILGDVFQKSRFQPTIAHMEAIYRDMARASPIVMKAARSSSLFEPRVFRQLVVLATEYAQLTLTRE